MAWIASVTVDTADAQWLVKELRKEGRADDVTAAHAIERAIARLAPVDDLTDLEKAALLRALVDPPAGLLRLRGVLLQERRFHA